MGKPNKTIALVGQAKATIKGRTELIIGTVPDTSPVKGDVPVENVQTLTSAVKDLYFGARTSLRKTIDIFLEVNKAVKLDVQPLEQPYGGSASIGKVTIAGLATGAGNVKVQVVDEDYEGSVDVAVGDTPSEIATAIVAKLATSIYSDIPVTAEVDTDDVKFTAYDEGIIGNKFNIKVIGQVEGITFGITPFAGGTGEITYTADKFPARRYTGVLIPNHLLGSVSVFEGILEARYNAEDKIYDGVGFIGMDDSYSDIVSAFGSKNARTVLYVGNAEAPTVFPSAGTLQSGSAIMTPCDWRVAEFLAIRALRLTTGESIASYVMATNLDSIGGFQLASLPYFNTQLRRTATTRADILFDSDEKKALKAIGFTVIDVNSAENAMLTADLVTPYKTNALGADDITFKYLNFIDTGSVCREYIANNIDIDLGQSRLTEGEVNPDRNIKNAESLDALYMKYYAKLGKAVLVQVGNGITKAVQSTLNTVLDPRNREYTQTGDLYLVSQIGQVKMTITQKFSV